MIKRASAMDLLCDDNGLGIEKYFKKDPEAFYINEKGQWRCRSVHYGNQFRFNKAQKEAKKEVVKTEQIVEYVNDFLDKVNIMPVKYPQMNPEEIDYVGLKLEYQLEDERDIVWMKFTADYDKEGKGRRWEYNTSGIIVHKLGKQWDTSFVLVFPLRLNNTKYSHSHHKVPGRESDKSDS